MEIGQKESKIELLKQNIIINLTYEHRFDINKLREIYELVYVDEKDINSTKSVKYIPDLTCLFLYPPHNIYVMALNLSEHKSYCEYIIFSVNYLISDFDSILVQLFPGEDINLLIEKQLNKVDEFLFNDEWKDKIDNKIKSFEN